MSRSFDTIPKDMDRAAEVPPPLPPLMSVCPFCGAISEKKNEGSCPRCKMENTALTRQATRARVGPWYVMQARNPSAPGMKCGTLMALIRKGQVTPRSVIRGPTTFQLWRFAARVKGISREFGLCYSCGGELQRTSTFCPRCSRSQELPPNPDALLENEAQPAKNTIRVAQPPRPAPSPQHSNSDSHTGQRLPPRAPSERASSERAPGERASGERAPSETDSSRSPRPPTQMPSAAETMAELADLPSPHNAPPDMQSRARQRPQEGVLSARELAAVFSLQYDPTMDVSGAPRRKRPAGLAFRLVGVAASLVIVGGAAAILYFTPSLRQRIVAWVQDSSPSASTSTDAPPTAVAQPKSIQSQPPMWMMPPPVDSPPITAPAAPPAKHPSETPAPPISNQAVGQSSPIASPISSQAPTPPPVKQQPAVQQSAAAPQPVPARSAAPQPASQQPAPAAPIVASDTVSSSSESAPPNAAATVEKLRQSAAGDLDSLAMELRANGMEADGRHDYAAAEYYYQQVETLPHDHWPGDITQLLASSRQKLAASDSH